MSSIALALGALVSPLCTKIKPNVLICAEKHSYIDMRDSYDAKTSKTWMTQRPEFERPLGAPKGPTVRAGYSYTREFAHASVRLDIEMQTGEIVCH
ncbi:MAG: putative glycoside hydrolase [Verrucomicrobia bacterium]|nr:putative glycoside hydrolase [Verrucomicrobiota bacterium]